MRGYPMNQDWIFTKNDQLSYASEEIKQGEAINLPHTWNAVDGQGGDGEYYRGQCWYQRRIELSPSQLEKQLFLEIGAAGNQAKVYINGKLAGESRCGYSMIRIHLNGYVHAGSNLIAVAVDNRADNTVFPLMADFTFYGGLYREIKLIVMEDIHFDTLDYSRDGVYLQQQKLSDEAFQLTVNGTIINENGNTVDVNLKLELRDAGDGIVAEQLILLSLQQRASFTHQLIVDNPILWDGIDQPYLYQVRLSIITEGSVYDVREIAYGFRTIEVTEDRGLLLNGKAMKINGVSRHQDFGGVGNAITREHMEEDISLIMEVGANSVRLAHYQHDDYFYSLCDKKGLLVWAEIPFISVPSTEDPHNTNAIEQLEKLMKQAYNHCSIYCWGIQNEITIAVENEQTYSMLQQLADQAKRLDPYRLTAQANIYSVANDSVIHDYADISGYNLYYGWYYGELTGLGERLDAYAQARPHQPTLVSEYGVDSNPRFHSYTPKVKDYSEEYQLLFHNNALQTINERPYVLGGYVWNMFDFGSAVRDEGGEKGKNLKGLITIDRKLKKDTFYLYKAYWSKQPFIHLAGRRFQNRHEALNDIVILSNLSTFTLFRDDEVIAEIVDNEPLTVVKDVQLIKEKHLIRVEAITADGGVFRDEMILHCVAEEDKSYQYVKQAATRNVTNWFERYDLTNVKEVQLKGGHYSTFDTIAELYHNEQAKAVFKKYFGGAAEDPRFAPLKGTMSIEKMAKISAFNIPQELLALINTELNAIKK